MPIRPHYKNPKLLAQFVSPHTGLVYKSHITGLCEFMQKEVEREVRHAKKLGTHFSKKVIKLSCSHYYCMICIPVSGFLSHFHKELHYTKDPALFSASRPMKKNPF